MSISEVREQAKASYGTATTEFPGVFNAELRGSLRPVTVFDCMTSHTIVVL
jgi:hypothetical protein